MNVQEAYQNNLPQSANDWTPVSTSQHFLPQSNDTFNDSLLIGHDNSEAPNPGRLPFDHYNMEEMWDWMFFMDSANHFPSIAVQDSN